jgi:hypothetical protein
VEHEYGLAVGWSFVDVMNPQLASVAVGYVDIVGVKGIARQIHKPFVRGS